MQPTKTLDYVTPKHEPANPQAVKAMVTLALVCWLVPLVLGCLILVGFAVTGNDAFTGLGALTITLGSVAALAGIVLVLVAFASSARLEPGIRTSLRRRGSLALIGILVNFPMAAMCLAVGLMLPSKTAVTVVNTGANALIDVRLDLLGKQTAIGDLSPGQKWRGSTRRARGRLAVTWVESGGRRESVYSENTDLDGFSNGINLALDGNEVLWD